MYSKNNGSDQNILDGYTGTDRDQIDTSPNHPRWNLEKSSYFGVPHAELVRGAGRLLDVVAARLRDLRGKDVVLHAGVGRFNFGFVERKSMVIDGSRDVRGARGLR